MTRKRKQQEIPGTERTAHDEVEAAANAYRDARDERMELTELETEKRDALIAAMRAAKLEIYKFTDGDGAEITVTLNEKTSVKVRKNADDEGAFIDDEPSPEPEKPKRGRKPRTSILADDASPFANGESAA